MIGEFTINRGPGIDVMILKNFRQTFSKKTTATFCKSLIIKLGFEKNAISWAEIGEKTQRIVMVTSTRCSCQG
jgi:hypothetical protein